MSLVRIVAAALLISTSAAAHELTPTYFKFKPSFVEGVLTTQMSMWNRRADAEYYEVMVLDRMWKKIPFATSERLFRLSHLSKRNIDIYIKAADLKRVELICTASKQLKTDVDSTGIRSMICSRIER